MAMRSQRGFGGGGYAPYARPGGRGGACDNCFAFGHVAARCPAPATCHACGSDQHVKRDCPNTNKQCDLCGKIGHLKFKCRLAAGGGGGGGFGGGGFGGGGGGGACHGCGEFGHRVAECPYGGGGGGGGGGGKECYECGQIGHIAARCPKNGGGRGGGGGGRGGRGGRGGGGGGGSEPKSAEDLDKAMADYWKEDETEAGKKE
eukprot:Tamp_29933.p2 GENE.Tamp_29933~~Tamp_29933.p2  ORF type:complete len:211 (+),score=57.08 Tamp_29933:25-633(+)